MIRRLRELTFIELCILVSAVLLVVIAFMIPHVARAEVYVRDTTGRLYPEDVAELQSAGRPWPFDVHVLIDSSSAREAFRERVQAGVEGERWISIGLDPERHLIALAWGRGLSIRDRALVFTLAKAYLADGNLVGGVKAIGERFALENTRRTQ